MARALSVDLRQRIVADRHRGLTVREIAERFHVTERTICSLFRHQQTTVRLRPFEGVRGASQGSSTANKRSWKRLARIPASRWRT